MARQESGKRSIRSCTCFRSGSEETDGNAFDGYEEVCVSNGLNLQKSPPWRTNGRWQLRVRVSVPWTAEEDACLLYWAGYDPVNKIAQRLGRSVRAVRFRLGALGMSAKVSDGWSLTQLRKLLRMSLARLRYLIGTGILRVRDSRITTESILALCSNNGLSLSSNAGGAGLYRD